MPLIYPTGGDKVMQVAMDILEKRPYERDTKLSTALVDKTNARVMQLQTDPHCRTGRKDRNG